MLGRTPYGTRSSPPPKGGIPLRDVQEAASHADPRTTMRYDRARTSLDRHPPYIVAAYVAGVPRSAQPLNHRPGRLAARPMAAKTVRRHSSRTADMHALVSYGRGESGRP
jgi:hypothetical protein